MPCLSCHSPSLYLFYLLFPVYFSCIFKNSYESYFKLHLHIPTSGSYYDCALLAIFLLIIVHIPLLLLMTSNFLLHPKALQIIHFRGCIVFFLCFSTFLNRSWKLNFILAGCKLLVNLYTGISPLCFSEGLVLGFIIVVS